MIIVCSDKKCCVNLDAMLSLVIDKDTNRILAMDNIPEEQAWILGTYKNPDKEMQNILNAYISNQKVYYMSDND